MRICDYGCGREAKYQFQNGKWCCSKYFSQCPEIRKKNTIDSKHRFEDPILLAKQIEHLNTIRPKQTEDELCIHHIHPQKTHPEMSLDPDNGLVCCGFGKGNNCHLFKGHKKGTDCSIGNLAKLNCEKRYRNKQIL